MIMTPNFKIWEKIEKFSPVLGPIQGKIKHKPENEEERRWQ